MTLDDWRNYLTSLPAATEDMPFGPEILVYRLEGKIFALLVWQEEPMRLNLKCEPNHALSLRDTYPMHVLPGYHMNKRHWNTIVMADDFNDAHIKQWIIDSYDLIYLKLPKATQRSLRAPHSSSSATDFAD